MDALASSSDNALWTVGWGFSTRCDLHCSFCYSSRVRRQTLQPEVPLAAAEQFLINNGAAVHAFNFGTGECFLAPDFPQVLDLCRHRAPQAQVAVTTNGALADVPSQTLVVVERTMHECDVSLDFAQPQAHDQVRGRPGTWQRAVRALDLAREMGLQTSLVMVGTPQTLTAENLRGMMGIAAAHRVALRINLYMPTFGDMTFLPSREAVFELLLLLKDWGVALRSSDRLFSHLLGHTPGASHLARRLSCRILPDGRVAPSTYLLMEPWVTETALASVDLHALPGTQPFERYATPPLPTACAACPERERCQGGSVERRWLWPAASPQAQGSPDWDAPDPLCPYLYPVADLELPRLSSSSPEPPWHGPTIHLDYLPTIIALPPDAG